MGILWSAAGNAVTVFPGFGCGHWFCPSVRAALFLPPHPFPAPPPTLSFRPKPPTPPTYPVTILLRAPPHSSSSPPPLDSTLHSARFRSPWSEPGTRTRLGRRLEARGRGGPRGGGRRRHRTPLHRTASTPRTGQGLRMRASRPPPPPPTTLMSRPWASTRMTGEGPGTGPVLTPTLPLHCQPPPLSLHLPGAEQERGPHLGSVLCAPSPPGFPVYMHPSGPCP